MAGKEQGRKKYQQKKNKHMISPTQLNIQLNPKTSTPRETGIYKKKETNKQNYLLDRKSLT